MTTRQISPRKGQKRKKPTYPEMLAAALLKIKIGDEWLIDDQYLREKGTPKEIRAYIDFDHGHRHAEGGGNRPQNLHPMRRPDHREKSRGDNTEIAKGKRAGKKHEEFRRKMLAKIGQGLTEAEREKPKRKAKIQSRNTLSKQERERAKEWKQRVTT